MILICSFSAVITAAPARTETAYASAITGGWARCGVRSGAWMSRARCARSPRRRARLSAAVIWVTVSLAAAAGSGALPSSSRASAPVKVRSA
jgi:hypothetical protein